MVDAGAISRALSGRVADLCRELLPAGVREGSEWRLGSLQGEKGKSLSVHLNGTKAGVWSDFSTGEAGDALDLVARVCCGGDIRQALDWAAAWLGMPRHAPPSAPLPSVPRAAAAPERDPEAEDRKAAAMRIFLAAAPKLAGTPVDLYFQGRGIDLAQLGRQPRSLRFHPALWNAESRRPWPAMVAAVTDDSGAMTAVHRTWLAQDEAGHWGKAPLQVAKASLGQVAGGTIRLWRGESGKSLAAAPSGETVVIAEGIETALSVAIACPELRVIASVSLGNMGRINLPLAIATVVIAADNDPPGSPADNALKAAAARFVAMGKTVRIARSPVGSDMNDCLQK